MKKKAAAESPTNLDWKDAIPQQTNRRAATSDGDAATRERRRHRWLVRSTLGLGLALVVAGGGWLWHTRAHPAPGGAYLPVQRVEVLTDGVLDAAWVEEKGANALSRGLLAVDVRALRDRLLADPQVITADVRVELPTTVWVTLTERQPAFLTKLDEGPDPERWRYVTAEGWIYEGTGYEREDLAHLAFVTGFAVQDFSAGQAYAPIVEEVSRLHALAAAALPRLSRDWLIYDVAKAEPGPGAPTGLIEVLGRDIARTTFARGNFDAQLARLREIEHWRQAEAAGPLASIDLSYAQTAVIRPHSQP